MELQQINFNEFLKDNGYEWSGYIAENNGSRYEKYYKCDENENNLNNMYILLGSASDWDEESGWVRVVEDRAVKYIRQDHITFKVYNATYDGPKLEKDLSNEWVRYKALNVDGYFERTLTIGKEIQARYPRDIETRKSLLALEIMRITRDANSSIARMEERLARSKEVEEILNQVQEERLIKKQIELGTKDNFKDTTTNDACLQHLTDTFGK